MDGGEAPQRAYQAASQGGDVRPTGSHSAQQLQPTRPRVRHQPRGPREPHKEYPMATGGDPQVTRTVFIARIPKEGVTDDVLFEDFSAYGRVLATKVFVPLHAFQEGKSYNFNGAFVEFESFEAALRVFNTVREYRGLQTEVKWGRRSLVESIKQQHLDQMERKDRMEGEEERHLTSTKSDNKENTVGVHMHMRTYGTVYIEEDPVDAFIKEQSWLWHQQIKAHYASIGMVNLPGMGSMGTPMYPPPMIGGPTPVMHSHSHSHPHPHLQPYLHPHLQPYLDPHVHPHYHHPAGLPITPQFPMNTVKRTTKNEQAALIF